MYVQRKAVARSRNHYCHGNIKCDFFIADLHVAGRYIKEMCVATETLQSIRNTVNSTNVFYFKQSARYCCPIVTKSGVSNNSFQEDSSERKALIHANRQTEKRDKSDKRLSLFKRKHRRFFKSLDNISIKLEINRIKRFFLHCQLSRYTVLNGYLYDVSETNYLHIRVHIEKSTNWVVQ